ncbi:MAG: Na+/H+ antiporter NhaC family protein [Prevotella sp.]|nr:sodium:proton antiporter [Prevotella sp.]MDY5656515.1 Na+/H+ antiporter NhaC family protein [Prevotella sp.]
MLVGMLAVTIRTYGSDSLSGPSQVVLLMSAAICCVIGSVFARVPWRKFEQTITQNISQVATALIILLFIGALGGAWMVSGIVPTMIYYGLELIHPSVFLASTCVISALVSIMTGSSWTTIATIGLALMGIGRAQGFEEGWIAGAIISGAYFGDKVSPLSDTTVLAAGACDVPLFTHIRYMMLTTIPSMVVALLLFIVAGLLHDTGDLTQLETFRLALAGRFHISLWLMLVPLLTAVMIVRRLPAIVTMFASTLLAMVFALLFQPEALTEIGGGDLFSGAMQSVFGSTSLTTSDPMLSELAATRGMSGMMSTIWLILCAVCFGATMTAGGMTEGITRMFISFAKGRMSTVSSTVASGLLLNATVADQYICILLSGNVFRNIYEKRNLESRLLSRTTEDAVTVTSVLVPWNSCGMTQSTVLGVSTLTYLPYCFFNLISPFMSILMAAIGYQIKPRRKEVQ